MRKLPARKLLCVAIAGALFLPLKGFTLGLGEIEVNSALNQKLNADIELLSATEEDSETIIVKLASRKEFSRAGLDRPYLLNDLRFKSKLVDGVPHIIVSTGKPVREPFLNFLIEVDWPNGHLLREYTVLLDPPVFMTQSASTASAPAAAPSNQYTSSRPSTSGSTNVVPVVTPGTSFSSRPETSAAPQTTAQNETQAVKQPGAMQPAVVPAPVIYQQQTINNQPVGSYRIKQGDTAWSLADAMRPDQSVSVEQMMIAMLRANPESFINENVNGLKRGYILRIPDYDQIVSVPQQDAKVLVREQAALWRQYQQSQTGGQPASAMPSDGSSGSAVAGDAAITGEEDDAYLEIVSAGSGSSTVSGKDPTDMTASELRAELALARERVETERVEKEALQNRVDTLEQNVGKMKGMLSIEDDEMSDIQGLNLPADAELGTGLDAVDAEEAAEDSEAAAEDEIAAEDVAAEDMTGDADESAEGEEGSSEESSGEEAIFVDEADAEQAEMPEDDAMASPEAASPETASPEADVEPQVISRPAADPISKFLNDPILLAAAGGGLLLIAGLIALIIKRRKTSPEPEAPVMTLDDDAMDSLVDDIAEAAPEAVAEVEEAAADAGDAPGDDFDSDATMILDSAEDTIVAEPDPAAEADEEPRDDVIAEADVYLAYGIYQQAEELLAQAITDNPDRMDYRVKLAETLYASKNADAFIEVATEINELEGGENTPSWKKVMGMGQDLCSDNPLFQGSMVGSLDVDSLAPNAPEMDFDLGLDDVSADSSTPDLDLSLDDDSLELPDMDSGDNSDKSSSEASDTEAGDTGTVDIETGDDEIDLSDEMDETVVATDSADELEFDLSDAGAVEEPETSEDEFSLDIDASELDIDMVDETSDSAETEDDVELDIGDVDIDFGLDDDATVVATEAEDDIAIDLTDDIEDDVAIDLSDDIEELDMDLDEAATDDAATDDVATEETAVSAVDDSADDDDFDLSSLDDVDEISTKLDLARAYLDMGDHEGTRGILEEVIADGNDEQKSEANELMAKLD